MDNKIKYLILFAAVAVAAALYFFGIKKINPGRKNFFYTSLLIALAFMGCNFSTSNASSEQEEEGQLSATKGQDDPEFIKDLNETKEWKTFKEFWKDLDKIEAAKDATPQSFGSYFDSGNDYNKTYDNHNNLSKMVRDLEPDLKKLCGQNLLDTLEARLLINMCNERLDYIFYGHQSMMMRMVVNPCITKKENTMANIEFRIDTILQLGQKGLIDSDEMKKALDNITLEIKDFGVLDILGKYHMYYSLPYESIALTGSDSLNSVDFSTYGFDKSYNEFMKNYNSATADEQQKELYSKYVVTKKELDSFAKNQQRFCAIINDLIMND